MNRHPISIASLICMTLLAACQGVIPAAESPAGPVAATVAEGQSAIIRGQALGPDGRVLAGAVVRTFAVASPEAPLAANGTTGLIANAAAGRRTQAAIASTRTDDAGSFTLALPAGATCNLEVLTADGSLRAWRPDITARSGNLGTLQVKATGTLSGRVTMPDVPGVTNFEGVDVFVPGSAYAAKCDDLGRFTLDGMAEGRFTLVAIKAGLGRAVRPDVEVTAGVNGTLGDMALVAAPPRINSVFPPVAAVGEWVTLTGRYFGATEGLPVAVSVAGLDASRIERYSDTRLRFQVPVGVRSGEIQVHVGGLSSEATTSVLIDGLGIDLELSEMTTTPGTPLSLRTHGLLGDQLVAIGLGASWGFSPPAIEHIRDAVVARTPGRFTARTAVGNLEARLSLLVLSGQAEVTTVVGAGYRGYADGPLMSALLGDISGLALMADGRVLVADSSNQMIRVIDFASGSVRTFAGINPAGGDFADGPPDSAKFWAPRGITRGNDGNYYVADFWNYAIRRIDPAGTVTTLAGTNSISGLVDGLGLAARFGGPNAITSLDDGRLLVTDKVNHAIRTVTLQGEVTTLVGDGIPGQRDGPSSLARLESPRSAIVARDGAIWIADREGRRLRLLKDQRIQTVLELGQRLETPYVVGPRVTRVRDMDAVADLRPGPGNSVLVVDEDRNRLAIVWPDGTVNALAGGSRGESNGLGAQARFWYPKALEVLPNGDVLVADSGGGTLRRVHLPPEFKDLR